MALEIDAASLLPADDSGYGFDNIGDVLTVSPLLLEKYLSAAATVSRLAVGAPALAPTSTEFHVPPATVQTERESRDLPIGSRGGIAIRHHFPLDAEYVIKVRLQRGKDATTIVGMSEERHLDIRLDAGPPCVSPPHREGGDPLADDALPIGAGTRWVRRRDRAGASENSRLARFSVPGRSRSRRGALRLRVPCQ